MLPARCHGLELKLAAARGHPGLQPVARRRRQLAGAGRRRAPPARLPAARAGRRRRAYRVRLESASAPVFESASCDQLPSRLHFLADAPGTYKLGLRPPGAARRAGVLRPRQRQRGAAVARAAAGAAGSRDRRRRPCPSGRGRRWPRPSSKASSSAPGRSRPRPRRASWWSSALPRRDPERDRQPGQRPPPRGRTAPSCPSSPRWRRCPSCCWPRRPAGPRPALPAAKARPTFEVAAGSRDAELLLFARGPFERHLRFVHVEKTGPGRADRELVGGARPVVVLPAEPRPQTAPCG